MQSSLLWLDRVDVEKRSVYIHIAIQLYTFYNVKKNIWFCNHDVKHIWIHTYFYNYKVEEFVCLIERTNLRNYWYEYKKYFSVGLPFSVDRIKISFDIRSLGGLGANMWGFHKKPPGGRSYVLCSEADPDHFRSPAGTMPRHTPSWGKPEFPPACRPKHYIML